MLTLVSNTEEFTIDDIHDYLEAWRNEGIVDDYVIAYDSGYTEICIHLMQGSGALSSDSAIENAIINYKVSLKEFKKQCQECFKGVIIMTNPNTNETWWIPNAETHGLDYFVTEDECIAMGYTEKTIF